MMKKIIYAVLMCMIISSCDVHTSNNGDLDGFWCLTQVDTLANGKSVEYRDNRVFWAFTAGLMTTRQMPADDHEEYVYHFEHNGNTLSIGDAYLSDRVNGDRLIKEDSLFALRPHGINDLHEVFTIEHLSSSSMTLKGNMLKLNFEKY